MEADNDDVATDFGTEQVQITPNDKQTPKESENNGWDECKLEKELNMQVSKDEESQLNKKEYQDDQKEPQQNGKIDSRVQNDKNFVTETLKTSDKNFVTETLKTSINQPQLTQQKDQATKEPTQMEQPSKEDISETQSKFQQLQINVNVNDSEQKEQNLQVCLLKQLPSQVKQYTSEPQYISKFSTVFNSTTITLNPILDQAQQSKYYFQNLKLALTQPITSLNSSIVFRLDNIKYCVGVGVGIQEILQKHGYDYKSTTSTEMGHGLYIVTSQGYSWSHSEQDDDDMCRQGFNKLYSGVNLTVKLEGENLLFKCKKSQFSMELPSRIREKYTLCFCVYLHEKTDAVSIVPQ